MKDSALDASAALVDTLTQLANLCRKLVEAGESGQAQMLWRSGVLATTYCAIIYHHPNDANLQHVGRCHVLDEDFTKCLASALGILSNVKADLSGLEKLTQLHKFLESNPALPGETRPS